MYLPVHTVPSSEVCDARGITQHNTLCHATQIHYNSREYTRFPLDGLLLSVDRPGQVNRYTPHLCHLQQVKLALETYRYNLRGHVAEWERYKLHGLRKTGFCCYLLYAYYTNPARQPHNGRTGLITSITHYLIVDRDLSGVCNTIWISRNAMRCLPFLTLTHLFRLGLRCWRGGRVIDGGLSPLRTFSSLARRRFHRGDLGVLGVPSSPLQATTPKKDERILDKRYEYIPTFSQLKRHAPLQL